VTHERDESFWRAKRELVALPAGKVNLNAGTLSPTPLPVLAAVNRLRGQMARDPSDFLWRRTGPLIERARGRVAKYVNCDARDLLLLPNATYAINVVVNSLQSKLPRGAEVLTSDHEYGSMMFLWHRAAERMGWTVRQVTLPFQSEDPGEIVEAFRRAIGDATRVLYFSHGTTTTGLVLPARELSALARERGLMCIVDGAHAPGMVPLDLRELAADFYAANCHKWMMAPAGAGFLHVAPQHKSSLESLVTSWGFDYDRSTPEAASVIGATCWQYDHEFHGTLDRCPQMVLPEALDFREELGGDDAIRARVREIATYARERLPGCGLAPVTPNNPAMSGPLVAFDYPCDDPIEVRDRLYHEHGIECPLSTANGGSFLRVSCAWFVTREEIDKLADAVVAMRG
jgi:isopenicillin-N epimerase